MKKILLIALMSICQFAFSQDKGTVTGTLTDKGMNGDPLPFANVFIKGTSIGGTTDMDGKYTISVPAGSQTLVFSFVGYKTIERPITIIAGKTLVVNQEMRADEGVALEEVKITGTVSKEKESALLLEQKKAVTIEQKIGKQELSRKGVSDVATALTKTTGISKQEGTGGVFVRGLGDRYNVTTLNGLPLPSNNPSKKNINLDIFSTDIIEFLAIDKTFNVKNYGDFAGANVNISSKDYRGKGFLQLGLGLGINSEAISKKQFYLNEGPNFSGFYSKKYPSYPLNNYNFTTSWDREPSESSPVNQSVSLIGGESFKFGDDTRLNIFGVASFDNDYKHKSGVARGNVTVSGVPSKNLTFEGFSYDTNTTLMGNLAFKHKKQEIKYNALFINTSSQKQNEYTGTIDEEDYAPEGGGFIQRAVFERNKLFVHQLLGEHEIGEKFKINWGGAYNFVDSSIPNRRQLTITPDNWDVPEGPKSFKQTVNASDTHRFYQNLDEEELAANASLSYKFSKDDEDEFRGKLTLGYSGRFKKVEFDATQFNFRINQKVNQPIVNNIYNLDSYFNQANFDAGLFTIETFRGDLSIPNSLAPQTYDGNQDINAGFISAEYALSPKFTAIVGVRAEKIKQDIKWSTALDITGDKSELDEFQLLPMLSLKYELNDKQNLKFAASKSYTLPQYKERALFQFEEVTQAYVGNPVLYSSTDYNADIKWEFFPKRNELISLGVFGKYIEDPINDVTINSATNDVSWVNSGDHATVIGAEFEIKKNLIENEVEYGDKFLKSNLSAGFNASYMHSRQDLDGDKVIRETTAGGYPKSVDFSNEESRITGASDLLLNADLTYFKEFRNSMNIQGTLVFNYFSDRIFALGTEGKGDLVDAGVPTLDFVLKSKVHDKINLGLSFKNILNPTIERKQEVQDIIVSQYKLGSNIKFSLTYEF